MWVPMGERMRSQEIYPRGPGRGTGLVDRRQMIGGMAGVFALQIFGRLHADDLDEMLAARKELQEHPLSTVKILERPDPNDKTLIIFTDEDGVQVCVNLRHLFEIGWVADQIEDRKQNPVVFDEKSEYEQDAQEPDIQPDRMGSGFAVQIGHFSHIGTNVHVLKSASKKIEKACARNKRRDISMVPKELLRRYSGDGYDLSVATISEDITNADLRGRNVRITGFGSQIIQIEGPALQLTHCRHGKGCECCLQEFILKVPLKDLKPTDIPGMSGSLVEDAETGEGVGILHSVSPSHPSPDARHFQMHFSGPEDLRRLRDKAVTKRMRHGGRYDIAEILRDGEAPATAIADM